MLYIRSGESVDLSSIECVELEFTCFGVRSKRRHIGHNVIGKIYARSASGERVELVSTGLAISGEMLYQSALRLANLVAEGLNTPLKISDEALPHQLRESFQKTLNNEGTPVITAPLPDKRWSLTANPHLSRKELLPFHQILCVGSGEIPPAQADPIRVAFSLVLLLETLCL